MIQRGMKTNMSIHCRKNRLLSLSEWLTVIHLKHVWCYWFVTHH